MDMPMFEVGLLEQLEAAQARIRMLETDINELLGIQPTYSYSPAQEPNAAYPSDVEMILESAPIAMYTIDPFGRVTFAQGRAFTDIGVRTTQVTGMNIFMLFEDDVAIIEAHQRVLAGYSAYYEASLAGLSFQAWLTPVSSGAVGVVIQAPS